MSLILPALAVTAAISVTSSTLVGVYSMWQYRRPSESVFARNARLDHEAAGLHGVPTVFEQPASSESGSRHPV